VAPKTKSPKPEKRRFCACAVVAAAVNSAAVIAVRMPFLIAVISYTSL
jgi:hypothetical protein